MLLVYMTAHGYPMGHMNMSLCKHVYRSRPQVYVPLSGPEVRTNQYSYTHHSRELHLDQGDKGLPGVFVTYEYSPIMVRIYDTEYGSSAQFLYSVIKIGAK